jgi:hypothetical protein
MSLVVIDYLRFALALPKKARPYYSGRMGMVFASKRIGCQCQPLNLVISGGSRRRKALEIVAYPRAVAAALGQQWCRAGKTEAQNFWQNAHCLILFIADRNWILSR